MHIAPSISMQDTRPATAPAPSAFRIADHFDSDHAESYPGQWRTSKTIAPTARGVRQKGEALPKAGGVRKSGAGRVTVKTRKAPSRPMTTTGLTATSGGFGMRGLQHQQVICSGRFKGGTHAWLTPFFVLTTQAAQHRCPPPGRWIAPDRGRRLPLVLYDHATKECVRPGVMEPKIYNRDFGDKSSSIQSSMAWTSCVVPHNSTWTRSPNTLLTGQVYEATVPRRPHR